MIEIADNVPQKVLYKHAIVYDHLINLYEKQWLTVYNKLDGVMRTLIFCQTMDELIRMAQEKYLDNYYERITRNAV